MKRILCLTLCAILCMLPLSSCRLAENVPGAISTVTAGDEAPTLGEVSPSEEGELPDKGNLPDKDEEEVKKPRPLTDEEAKTAIISVLSDFFRIRAMFFSPQTPRIPDGVFNMEEFEKTAYDVSPPRILILISDKTYTNDPIPTGDTLNTCGIVFEIG